MWDLAVREEDFQAVDSMLVRYRGSVPLSFRLVPARARGNRAAVAALLEEARTLESRQLQLAARYGAAYLGEFAFADSIIRLDLQWRERPANRAQAQIFLGWLDLARGRWTDGRRAFDLAESMEGAGPVVVHRAFGITLPFLDPPALDLAQVRAELERWRPDLEDPGLAGDPPVLRPHLRLYLLALVSSRQDDGSGAERYREALGDLPVPSGFEGVVGMMTATVDADRAWRAGRAREAIEVLRRATPQLPIDLVALPRPAHLRLYGFEHARFVRAAAAMMTGDDTEALPWLQYGLAGSPQEMAYRAPVNLRLGELFERLGDPTRAVAHYRIGLELWSRVDSSLAPTVAQARQHLNALAPQAVR